MTTDTTAVPRRKLIEVALPLEKINAESAREKSIRHGHPSTLHLWWSRKPLATARAVLFAQLVDDPSSHPDRFPTEESVDKERKRLHEIIEQLVVWENVDDESLLRRAHEEILTSTEGNPPSILDPFAGGGSIPLEAQRLGLEAHASDLNPVAVLINKALIEIPPKFSGQPPVFPGAADAQITTWPKATGLAEDVRRYGQWMRDEAEKLIGHLYPKALLPDGSEATVIAWIWARTVSCPNPACGIAMPLTSKWWLSKKKGKEAYVIPRVVDGKVKFSIGYGLNGAPTKQDSGTVGRTGAMCIGCGAAVDLKYIRSEGRAGRMGAQLLATVAEGDRTRIYLEPTPEHEAAAEVARPKDAPEGDLASNPRDFKTPNYGMTTFADLFTLRQLTALTTFSDLVAEARKRILADALAAGMSIGDRLEDGGTGAAAYADAVATYLGLGVSRLADIANSLCAWEVTKTQIRHLFTRQAIAMIWDFGETTPFGNAAGSYTVSLNSIAKSIRIAGETVGFAVQASAAERSFQNCVISTDPPYYDNIGYSDLSDFFYVWLRRSLRSIHPGLMGSILVPKAEELVANPYRHNGREGAQKFFEEGFREVFQRAREVAMPEFPITVYYAFKQQDANEGGQSSTGWETLLEGMIRSGWVITATWPMRSELSNRMLSQGTNALASSIVLALRPRDTDAPTIDRRGFINALKDELPDALRELQQGAIAPVDLPQAAIGPGMAVFSRFSGVLTDDGSKMTVRAALARINEILDEVLAEQEGDFDPDTRFAIAWFRQYGFDAGMFGDADNMARARNASLEHLERSGILTSRAGKVALLSPEALGAIYSDREYDPATDPHISTWEVVMHLSRALTEKGVPAAAALLSRVPESIDRDLCKELAFLLFTIAEDLKRTQIAIEFNSLGTAWNDIVAESRNASTQLMLGT
ncbi:DUF1156 domain-containing protein (plasmid) [Rhodococcus pyridinivorans]|uniref:DUF1156 domain-containing protein n=1 Tax=Rhodococcus pyridinivorans TaxID=103816 RepID=UPI001E38E782|nr:DUF1156 domain-containing protein [Rhodococcus pyridinivorans]UGQ60505.1 DUF1156 domain-containing protein [Rhodococcus pyridinivorans]